MRISTLAACALTVALTGAGCGDGNDNPEAAAPTTGTPPEVPKVDHSGDAVTVTAVDYAFEGLPASVDAGTQLALVNDSASEVHELVALRLADDEERSAEELVGLPPAELEAAMASPPAMVIVAPPGEDGFAAVGDGTLTEPGRYVVVCFIPTGADPEAYLEAAQASNGAPPSVAGGPPHVVSGMYGEVTVR